MQGEQGIGSTIRTLENLTKVTDKERKQAQLLAKETAEQRERMKQYRGKASAYNLKANQNLAVLSHLVQKQNLVIGRLRGQISTQFLAMHKRILHLRKQVEASKQVSQQHKSLSREHRSMLSQHTQEQAKIERELLQNQMVSARIEKEWADSQYEDTFKSHKKPSQKLLDQSKEPSSSFSQVKIKNQYNNIIEVEDDLGNIQQDNQLFIGAAQETPGIQAQNLISSMSKQHHQEESKVEDSRTHLQPPQIENSDSHLDFYSSMLQQPKKNFMKRRMKL